MADDRVPVPDKQLCLYEVDLSQLFSDGDLNRKVSLSLASISNDRLNESYLKSFSNDTRRRLYVLTDPIESWKERGDPTVYCAIQVRFEVNIKDSFIGSRLIPYFPQLKSRSVVGAEIICLYEAKDGNGYVSKALDSLIRLYDGKEVINPKKLDLLFSPRKYWTNKLHYLRIDIALDFNAVIHWEGYGFFALLVWETGRKTYSLVMFRPLPDYELEISGNDERCSLPTLVEQSRNMFVGLLSSDLSNLDHDLTMWLLERFSRIIHAKKQPRDKMWIPRAEFVDFLIRSRGQVNPEQEKVGHLNFALGYFTGKLPVEFSGDEQAPVLYLLQNRGNLPQDNNALSSLASAREKVGRFYKTLPAKVEPLLFPFRWNRKLDG